MKHKMKKNTPMNSKAKKQSRYDGKMKLTDKNWKEFKEACLKLQKEKKKESDHE